jgi:hypothetical protein
MKEKRMKKRIIYVAAGGINQARIFGDKEAQALIDEYCKK